MEVTIVDLGTGVISSLPAGAFYYLSRAAYAGLVDRLRACARD
jgi:hypothetical protein